MENVLSMMLVFTFVFKLKMVILGSVHGKFNFFRFRYSWSGGNENAWDGKGPGLKTDRTCFFFKREIFCF